MRFDVPEVPEPTLRLPPPLSHMICLPSRSVPHECISCHSLCSCEVSFSDAARAAGTGFLAISREDSRAVARGAEIVADLADCRDGP